MHHSTTNHRVYKATTLDEKVFGDREQCANYDEFYSKGNRYKIYVIFVKHMADQLTVLNARLMSVSFGNHEKRLPSS